MRCFYSRSLILFEFVMIACVCHLQSSIANKKSVLLIARNRDVRNTMKDETHHWEIIAVFVSS